ncbi:MAG: class I SAM-dependent rRNA methyltransferase [Phycisphaerales bacterium]|nr:class I SAM-dependent rRNA methyltransferase [Phycisphaerales bacterium]
MPADGAVRLFHGRADGVDGLVIERFGRVLFVQTFEGRLRVDEVALRVAAGRAMELAGATAVYRKFFAEDRSAALAAVEAVHRERRPWIGEAAEEEFEIVENGLRFGIRPYDGYSVGLFLEQRENRRRVRELAAGRDVLNTFAYTCGFSVVAAAGGAKSVTSVDVSGRYLDWGRRNLGRNGFGEEDWGTGRRPVSSGDEAQLGKRPVGDRFPDARTVGERVARIEAPSGKRPVGDRSPTPAPTFTFIKSDVLAYLRRAERQGREFDLIVLDPPTFGRDKKSGAVFSLASDLPRLVAGAIGRLRAGGLVLRTVNHRGTRVGDLERLLRAGGVEVVERPGLPGDFAGDAEFSKGVWGRAK